jgi:hypothetical protein
MDNCFPCPRRSDRDTEASHNTVVDLVDRIPLFMPNEQAICSCPLTRDGFTYLQFTCIHHLRLYDVSAAYHANNPKIAFFHVSAPGFASWLLIMMFLNPTWWVTRVLECMLTYSQREHGVIRGIVQYAT